MQIAKYLKTNKKYIDIFNDLELKDHNNIYIGNCASNLSKILAAELFKKYHKNLVYVCENIFEASLAYEMFCDLLDENDVSFFPQEEFISSELVASSLNFKLARMLTLYNISLNLPKLIVTCTEGITRFTMSKEKIKQSTLKFYTGQVIDMRDVTKELIARGYKKTPISENAGTFSLRGSIIDIYPINEDTLFRLNFFDNEIETIKKVNIETQMSIEKVNDIYIFPLYDIFYSEEEVETIINRINKNFIKTPKVDLDIEKIRNYTSLDQLSIYLPYIDLNYTSLLDLLDNPICFYEDLSNILEHEKASIIEISEYLLANNLKNYHKICRSVLDNLTLSSNNFFTSLNISSLNDIQLTKLIDLQTINNFEYNNNLRVLMEDLKINKDKTYIITHFDNHKLEFLEETFKQNNIDYNLALDIKDILRQKINLIVSKDAYGFIDYELGIEIITPHEYAPGKINKQSKYQKYYKGSTKIYNKDDLKIGDYVVHQDYGIGIYQGIETRMIRGNLTDYLKIAYAEEGQLLVPVENIYLLEKYNTSRDALPKLNKIDGKEWKKKCAKVKEKVMDVAKRLIKIQAERETKQGYIYNEDTVDQFKFEADFEYNETADQIQAINDVKKDMESSKPVDRLICGDVGFGKTEIAMRAAFKACENNKQVAYLAPTTVLSRQHYYTFKERFEKYGIRVELLNRFVSTKKQNDILKGLKAGYVDILIGTHRILSNDILFKDLGLLIIDEEQRFGVMHKERIKELKANVDVLTLTATPIPRTLQMSLSGLRDLSLIETPPTNRLPVQTYVLESNKTVIREAINRELGRGGQVFYLLNRIEELNALITKIHNLCPKAKIGMIHGKMEKDQIETQLMNFLDKNFDVLVCTTIIETGIDIPNANTLIIENADHLGLSQLYQIRGRVGRSDRISYAYLMYSKGVLTDKAKKRLDAIKEFTSLGSGYKIAMRDLALRGAGDILGDEQSGFIDAIGMDLYMKILNESINEIKGIKESDDHTHYNIAVERHIDDKYINDDEIRLEIHKEICKIKSRDQINMLINEYTDRYGALSKNVMLYMEEKYLEFLLKSSGIENFKETKDEVVLNFDTNASSKIDYKILGETAFKYAPKFNFAFKNLCIYIYINPSDYKDSYIYTLTKFLEKLKNGIK